MTPGEELFVRVHSLVSRVLDDDAVDADRDQLSRLMEESAEARQMFIAHMDETAILRWHCGAPQSELLRDLRSRPRPGRRPWLAGIAAVVALVGGLIVMGIRPQGDLRRPALPAAAKVGGVATLIRASGVTWRGDSRRWTELSRLGKGDILRFESGEVELVFDAGVEVVIRGPADFEVRTMDRAFSRLGKITARVGKDGQGFTIETPVAKVVDLGTEFAIEVSPSGSTDVAVFRGLVDLAVNSTAANPGKGRPQRLGQGEAMRIDPDGTLDRVMSITSDYFPESAGRRSPGGREAPILTDVRDNSPAGQINKFYRIVRSGLREDAPAYVDRNHEWNGLESNGMPAFLQGIEYVMPFNDDKFAVDIELSVDVSRPAVLYVFMSDNVPVPAWLQRDFVDTGFNIGLDSGRNRYLSRARTAKGPGRSIDTVFSVWRREIPAPATVSLGSVQPPSDRVGFNMYGIAAASLESAQKTRGEADMPAASAQ
jgi:hypothetical protein